MSEAPEIKTYAPPIDDPELTDFEALQELKTLQQKAIAEGLTAEETERSVSLVRMLRRTTAGPSAVKATKAKKATLKSQSLDELLG